MPLPDRLIRRLSVGDCWEWTGPTTEGYGKTSHAGRTWLVHRLVWTLLVGEIPPGLELDHRCKNTRCANPDHLEPVTPAENRRRSAAGSRQRQRTHCPANHEYTPENTWSRPDGTDRRCRTCRSVSEARRRKQNA